jgi:hypothetical protein
MKLNSTFTQGISGIRTFAERVACIKIHEKNIVSERAVNKEEDFEILNLEGKPKKTVQEEKLFRLIVDIIVKATLLEYYSENGDEDQDSSINSNFPI